jgi:hypothetical protein
MWTEIRLIHVGVEWRGLVTTVIKLRVPLKAKNFMTSLATIKL